MRPQNLIENSFIPYSFNGMEKDDEVKGEGNSYDFGARMHDPRVGRFLSLDPKLKDYPFMTPYCFAGNNPILLIDVNGEGPKKPKKEFQEFKKHLKGAKSITVTIYVDQPGKGGDRDAWEGNPIGDIDVGHTFVGIQVVDKKGVEHTIFYGFYPANPVGLNSPVTKGVILDDTGHPYDVAYEIKTSEKQAESVIDYAISVIDKKKKYNLNSFNCTDFGQKNAEKAGEKLPDTQGSWTGGGGSNPGDLGEDLRKKNKAKSQKNKSSKGTGSKKEKEKKM